MAFDIIELNTASVMIKNLREDGVYERKSGGNMALKTLSVEIQNGSTGVIKIVTKGGSRSITVPAMNLIGLGVEIERVAKTLSEAVYKSQQFYKNKKVKT